MSVKDEKKGEKNTFDLTLSAPHPSLSLAEELGHKPPRGIITRLITCYHSKNGLELEPFFLTESF